MGLFTKKRRDEAAGGLAGGYGPAGGEERGYEASKAATRREPQRERKDGKAIVEAAYGLLMEYRGAYALEWARQDWNERIYRGDYWDVIEKKDENEPRPVTPGLQSTIENISADLMDRIPQAIIKPEDPQDTDIADTVNALIEKNHDEAHYAIEFRELVHDLLVTGYCVQEVGYDMEANRGMGAAFIRHADVRNILFDPQADEINDGRGILKICPRTIRWLEQRYPEHKGNFTPDDFTMPEDGQLVYDPSKSSLLIEYWWREYDAEAGLWRVHMAKLAGHRVLEDSRDARPEGYFFDGEYPFVLTKLYQRKGTPLGLGLVDQMGKMQLYGDKLDQIITKNMYMASHNKLLITENSGFDEDDLRDWSREVHRGGNLSGIKWMPTPPLPDYIINYVSKMREDMKDYSGANDFSRGNVASGVTAASAISALQEMSSKRSRLIARLLYEAYREAVRKEIEVEREYNFFDRTVQLTRDGQTELRVFNADMLYRDTEAGTRVPIEMYVSIKVEQENRFQSQAQNENVLKMVELGILQPQQALELMVFDGKEAVLGKAAEAQQQPQPPTEEELAMEQAAAEQEALMGEMGGMQDPAAAMGGAAGGQAGGGRQLTPEQQAALQEMMRMQQG